LIQAREFRQEVNAVIAKLKMVLAFLSRYLNEGFSVVRIKSAEFLQVGVCSRLASPSR
jgi:Fe-S cluster assembly ATPase SufC